MTDSGLPSTSLESAIEQSRLQYRCVCGNLIEITDGEVHCDQCDRNMQLNQLDQSAETILIVPETGKNEKTSFPISYKTACVKEAPDDPLVGTNLGHFKILSPLGGGGMGTVYRALDESLQRYVALKVIQNSAGKNSEKHLQSLFQEARSQARLNHPHVAHIYYVGTDKETPFLAMELVGTETLADRIKKGGIPFRETIRYALQIAEALKQASQFDIVHGDIKPANVLIVNDQEKIVKLSDFGMARRISELKGNSNTISGTPNYLPPEATLGKKFDHRGDMYSLGVTLFEMIFDRLPYAKANLGKSLPERLKSHQKAKIEFPEVWPPGLPLELKEILEKLLAKDPENRYNDFSEVIKELKKIEPVDLPTANLIPRGLAWGFDNFLVLSVMTIIYLLLDFTQASLLTMAFAGILRLSFSTLFLIGVGTLQGLYGTTPGKALFQIRIVDQNGLKTGKRVLAPRTIFQFLLVWGWLVTDAMDLFRLELIPYFTAFAVAMVILIEMGFVLFKKGLSFHDQLFYTRVVLDARTERNRC